MALGEHFTTQHPLPTYETSTALSWEMRSLPEKRDDALNGPPKKALAV